MKAEDVVFNSNKTYNTKDFETITWPECTWEKVMSLYNSNDWRDNQKAVELFGIKTYGSLCWTCDHKDECPINDPDTRVKECNFFQRGVSNGR